MLTLSGRILLILKLVLNRSDTMLHLLEVF